MNDIKFIREHLEEAKQNFINQHIDPSVVERLVEIDDIRRHQLAEIEKLRQELNVGSKNRENVDEMRAISQKEKELSVKLRETEGEWTALMRQLPNLTSDKTPVGKDETENKIIETVGEITVQTGPAHDEIMTELNLLDIERATKVSGSRFYFLKNEAVELEFAIVRWVMEEAKNKGYELVVPPVLMKQELGIKAGHPEVETDDAYRTQKDDLYLVGSSEHSIMGMFTDETIVDLPKRILGFSTCFRREAGSYGKDVKGILRTHQFDKLELVSVTKPEDSESEFEKMLEFETDLLKQLKLPFRTVELCSGDISHAAARQVDIETWMPSQGKYRETHSCSNCTDYQTRSLGIRTKDDEGKTVLAHALNATAFAIGRILIAIVENNYNPQAKTITVPDVLAKYTGFSVIQKRTQN